MSSSDSEPDQLGDSLEPQTRDGGVKKRRLWSKQEDERLRLLVSYWGDQGGRRSNWDKIAANFESRSAKSCRKRWFHSLDPKLRRGRWNKTEDKILKESYDRLGPAWQRIAQLIPGRTDDQCAKRYNDVVSPEVQDRLRPWEPEEDEKLLGLYAKHGSKWQTIASDMPKRTGLTCRNRWRKLTRPVKANMRSESVDTNGSDAEDGPEDGGLRSMGPAGPESETREAILPFDVPGSNQIAGFPAGADANWLLAAGGAGAYGQGAGPGPAVNGSSYTPQRHLTITIDDPNNPPQNMFQQTHHAISDPHLDRILDFAAKHGQQIVIHQHIYQMQPHNSQDQENNQVQEQAQGQEQGPHQQHNNNPHQHHYQAPSPSIHQPLGHVNTHPMDPMAGYTSRSLNDKPQSSLLRTVHPPVQPPERPPSRQHVLFNGDHYGRRPHTEQPLPPPPPDEFLTRPLLFDENSDNTMMQLDTEEVDLLAFNPS